MRPDGAVAPDPAPAVSVLLLVSERPGDLETIYREHARALRSRGWSFEFVVVAQPWQRERTAPLDELTREGEPIRVEHTPTGASEAMLLREAAAVARSDLLLVLPGYPRVEAEGAVQLLDAVEEGAELAVARRHPRVDSRLNRLQTSLFHVLLRAATGVGLDDVASGVRAMRREVLEQVPVYGDFYRFLPVFADRQGYTVTQVDAPQHPDERRTRLHAPGEYLRRAIDLLAVFFLARFTYKPLRFFGLVGSLLGAAGAAILAVLFVQRVGGQPIADRPLLLLGVLLAVLGAQAFALGLIGEIVVHFNVPGRRRYRLASEDERERPGSGARESAGAIEWSDDRRP